MLVLLSFCGRFLQLVRLSRSSRTSTTEARLTTA